MDSSDTTDQEMWLLTKQYVLQVTSTMNISPRSVRVGVVNAGQNSKTILKLNEGTSQSALVKLLSEADPQSGGLDLDKAFDEATQLFKQHGDDKRPKVVMFITKGKIRF